MSSAKGPVHVTDSEFDKVVLNSKIRCWWISGRRGVVPVA